MDEEELATVGPVPRWSLPQLDAVLSHVRSARLLPAGDPKRTEELARALAILGSVSTGLEERAAEWLLESRLGQPRHRLAIYGTLAPGERNHHLLASTPGEWSHGFVQGWRGGVGGLPAFCWRPGAPAVAVDVFASQRLPDLWEDLDRFESAVYPRILVPVSRTDGSLLVANLYERRDWDVPA